MLQVIGLCPSDEHFVRGRRFQDGSGIPNYDTEYLLRICGRFPPTYQALNTVETTESTWKKLAQ